MVKSVEFSGIPVPIQELAEFCRIDESETKGEIPYVWYVFVKTADGIGSYKEVDYPDKSIGLGGAGVAGQHLKGKNPNMIGADADGDILQFGWAVAHAVIAGAGIVRAERDNTWMPKQQRLLDYMKGLGRSEPLRVLVTGSGFDAEELTLPVFKPNGFKTLVATSERGKETIEEAIKTMQEGDRPRAEIVTFGRERVDLYNMLKYLRRERGVVYADFEGGPDLAGQMLEKDLLDEYRDTTAPIIAGYLNTRGERRPSAFKAAFGVDEVKVMRLAALAISGSHTFNRYKLKA